MPFDSRPELPFDPDSPDERVLRPVHLRWGALALVGAGGVAGTLLRYGLARWLPLDDGTVPWATLFANLVGAFVLGALLEWLARLGPDDGWRRRARLLIGTGFCGGLTTYSTFAVEADLLVRSGDSGVAVGYVAASLVLGVVATVAGIAVAAGRRGRGAAA